MDRSRRGGRDVGVEPGHAHVVGSDERGLTGLAHSLNGSGMIVTGTGGCSVVRWPGAARGVTSRTRLLVHGPEVGRDHPARLRALRRGVRQETPAGWLGGQMRGRIGVGVAGGREAGVAAGLTAFILESSGCRPSVVLNTPAPQLGGWARVGTGPHVVAGWAGDAEGFAAIGPRVAVVLGVGRGPRVDPGRRAEALGRFVRAAPDDAQILALGHPSLSGFAPTSRAGGRFDWLSLRRGAGWWAADVREESGRFRFRIFHRGRYVMEARSPACGRRHLVGALAAAATCCRLGVPLSAIRDGVEAFTGLSRDFQARGSYRGVSLVDDEAGDAASVRESLAMARRAFGGRRLWAVLGGPVAGEAGRYPRALSAADRVLICGGGGPPGAPGVGPAGLGARARRVADVVEAISELDRHLEPGDVLLTLGADVGTIADAFIRRLPRDRQGG